MAFLTKVRGNVTACDTHAAGLIFGKMSGGNFGGKCPKGDVRIPMQDYKSLV